MPLETKVESLDGLDESVRGAYVQTDDGYVLDVEIPDTKGLKSALEKERKSVKQLNQELKKFNGFDLEEYESLQARAAEFENANPEKIEDLVNKRLKQNNESWENKYNDLQQKFTETNSRLGRREVDDELRKVGMEIGVKAGEPMEDFIARGRNVFKLTDDGVKPLKDGEIVYGESGIEPLTMREFGKTLSATATHLFETSGGGGAGTEDRKPRGGASAVVSKSDLKTPKDKAEFIGKHGREAYLQLPDTA